MEVDISCLRHIPIMHIIIHMIALLKDWADTYFHIDATELDWKSLVTL